MPLTIAWVRTNIEWVTATRTKGKVPNRTGCPPSRRRCCVRRRRSQQRQQQIQILAVKAKKVLSDSTNCWICCQIIHFQMAPWTWFADSFHRLSVWPRTTKPQLWTRWVIEICYLNYLSTSLLQVIPELTFEGLSIHWREKGFKKIITMVGAGISTCELTFHWMFILQVLIFVQIWKVL